MNDFGEKSGQGGQQFNLWLQQKFSEYVSWYSIHYGKIPSQNDWARHLGITNTNLSQYMLGNRKPDAKQAELLADKLGVEVYDRLGLPRRMPKNPILYYVADHWTELDETDQREIQEIIKNRLANRQGKGKQKRDPATA